MSMDTNDTVGIENSEFTGRAIAAEYVDHATGKRSDRQQFKAMFAARRSWWIGNASHDWMKKGSRCAKSARRSEFRHPQSAGS